ncbi:MAG: hypothetical protein ACTSU9_05785 [Promethearchaeota archaeon]
MVGTNNVPRAAKKLIDSLFRLGLVACTSRAHSLKQGGLREL